MTDTQTPQSDDRMLALLADGERLRAILGAALDCIVAMDATGRVLEWNPAAERTFGWTAAEALGREMADLIVPPALRERHRAGLARYLAGGEPVLLDQRIEITAVRRDGQEIPVELTITAIAGERGGAPVFLGYVRDITDRLAAEEELRASRARIVAAARRRPAPDRARPARRRAAAPRRPRAHAAARTREARGRPRAGGASCSTRRSRTWPRRRPSCASSRAASIPPCSPRAGSSRR